MQETNLYLKKEPYLTDEEVFSNIWVNPRKVFKFINAHNYNKYVYLLLILAGVANAFYKNTEYDLSGLVIFLYVFIGGLLGLIGNYIYAALINWTGSWLNGKAETSAILRTIAFSNIPLILTLSITIARYIIRGNGNFSDGLEDSNSLTYIIENILLILNGILGIWSFVIFVIGIAEIQKFTIIKAFLNTILPILVFVVPIVLVLIIFKLIA